MIPISIPNFKRTLDELHQLLNKTSNIDKELRESAIDATLKIESLIYISEQVPNDSFFAEIFITLHPLTHVLLERLNLYSSSDINTESHKSNYNTISKAIYDINKVYEQFEERIRNFEYKPVTEDKNINELVNTINLTKEFAKNYKELETKIHILDKLAFERIKEIDINFESKIKELKDQLGEVESSIAKKALSASFLNRAKKLETESKWWLLASSISILSFIGLAVWNFYKFSQISDLNFDTLDLHIRASIIYSPICVALFWAIWFCTKKYTHLCHLRDEYNYKHDLSESFIGYKNEVTFLDNLSSSDLKLFPILLSAVIQNICKSPLETNKEECHSPWSEIVSLVCKKGKDKID